MTLKNQMILIVEDDGLIALHLQELLQNAGYDIPPPVASGEEAIEYVRTCPLPDLILMDVTLDGRIDGIETARQIQESCSIPVIFLSAHSATNRIARGDGVRPSGFLGKPFTGSDVIAAVKKALQD
jgi:CheY-like chemotaxis protein